MALTDAKRRANNKYINENMTTLGCKMRKDDAAAFKIACNIMGTTPNAVFRRAVDDFMRDYAKQAESCQEAADKAAGEAGVLGMILGAGDGKTE